jgi:hypothetical protein
MDYDAFCPTYEQKADAISYFCHAASTSICCHRTANSEVAVWRLLFVMVRDGLVFFSGSEDFVANRA